MKKSAFITGLIILVSSMAMAQEIDIENMGSDIRDTFKKNPFKITGGVSANAVFYDANVPNGREDFTYFMNGRINLGFYNWSMPINFNYTNQGSKLGYQIPFKFNRLSLHPRYKWIQAHIGDASTSFSPYTYNGLIYTGAGLDLTPDFVPLKVSLFAGRLNKAIEDDGDTRTRPSYRRMGYGAKIGWEETKFKLGVITFYAKDDISSLSHAPDQKGILPQENLVLSFYGSYFFLENLELFAEYAGSSLTQDSRNREAGSAGGLSGLFYKGNSSTQYYKAYNSGFNFHIKRGTLGVRYEYIDPDYATLGSYYFNNDLENISVNLTYSFFENKLNLAGSVGRERDNLDNTKAKNTFRWVNSLTANLNWNERLSISGSYSNYSMYTNNRLNQFDNINENPLAMQQPLDSINFKQLSQNVNLNINYILRAEENRTENVNLNYSLNDMVNKENGIVRKGGISRFHNLSANYSIGFPLQSLSFAVGANYTNSYSGSMTTNIYGPSLGVNKAFFDNKLMTSGGASYNLTQQSGIKTTISNLRFSANYIAWEKHNFSLNAIQMFRQSNQETTHRNFNELTVTLGYNYNFTGFKFKRPLRKEKEQPAVLPGDVITPDEIDREKDLLLDYEVATRFSSEKYEDLPATIVQNIDSVIVSSRAIVPEQLLVDTRQNIENLQIKAAEVMESEDKKNLNQSKKDFQKEVAALDKKWRSAGDFRKFYRQTIIEGFYELQKEAQETDITLDTQFFYEKYGIDLKEINRNWHEGFKEIDRYFREQELEPDKRDLTRLAHYHLMDIIFEVNRFDDFLDDELVQKMMMENKEKYYAYFKQKLNRKELIYNIVYDLTGMYYEAYFQSFGQRF